MGIIYKITNLANGKFYIGSTMHKFVKRKSEHVTALQKGYHFNSHLQSAWNKYGEENFTFEVIQEFIDGMDQVEVLKKELEIIESLCPEYNICRKTAGGKLGRTLSEEEKKKIGDIHRGKRHSEETILKIKEVRKRQIITEDHKRKISESSKGRKIIKTKPNSDKQKETARKLLLYHSQSKTGLYSEEVNKKKSDTLKRVFNTPEMKEKLKSAARNRNRRIFYCFKNNELIDEFTNQSEAADILGIKKSGISSVLCGTQKSHIGYVFKYNK